MPLVICPVCGDDGAINPSGTSYVHCAACIDREDQRRFARLSEAEREEREQRRLAQAEEVRRDREARERMRVAREEAARRHVALRADTRSFDRWEDVPEELRADDRPCPTWGTRVVHRGCAAAVRWSDGAGWHRCATRAIKAHGLCPPHARRAGLIEGPKPLYPHGLDNRVGNAIRRNILGTGMTVRVFRGCDDGDILEWRMIGVAALPAIKRVQATWSDEELIRAFGLRPTPLPVPDIEDAWPLAWIGG
jgi:hypothetical protein